MSHTRCTGRTTRGQCRNRAQAGSAFCHCHGPVTVEEQLDRALLALERLNRRLETDTALDGELRAFALAGLDQIVRMIGDLRKRLA